MICNQLGFIEKLRDNFLTHKLFVDSIRLIDKSFTEQNLDDDFIKNMPYKYFMDKFLMEYTCEFKAFNDKFIAKLRTDIFKGSDSIDKEKFEKSVDQNLALINKEHRKALKTAFNLNKNTNKDLCTLIKDYIQLLVPIELLDGDLNEKYLLGNQYQDTYKKLRVIDSIDKSIQVNDVEKKQCKFYLNKLIY